jgi:hypothetical protein
MIILIGLENNIEGRSLAWALEHPGCFAYGPDPSSAVVAMAQAIPAYIAWMESHTKSPWLNPSEIDIKLVQVWDAYFVDDKYERVDQGYEVNAWFNHDWKPLTEIEVEQGLKLLSWTRADLLAQVSDLNDEQLDAHTSSDAWPIRGVLSHVGVAEWWYLNRLNLAQGPREMLPRDPFERLKVSRSRLEEVLPDLVGVELVTGKEGEFWSPRKLLRRAVWHEMDHIIHIQELLGG